ncbi:hypothetical protein CTRI78_v004157 [Colletotrichum trifolii]|uniref:Uncharacterized protein n=1 Tax=Colletotrichum trifolii TaxID=5466 RepID=A0A4R8RHL7_COLTR|nr:hypothetical protein CTRI78_v004157 [Colletotrichum trifolii]
MPPKRKAADLDDEESAIVETSVNGQMKITLGGPGDAAANKGTYPKIFIDEIIKNCPPGVVATVEKGNESAVYFNGQFMVDDKLIIKTLYAFLVSITVDPVIDKCSLSTILRVIEYPHITVGKMTRTKIQGSNGFRFETSHWKAVSKASETRCKYTAAVQLAGAIVTAKKSGLCQLGTERLAENPLPKEANIKSRSLGWTVQEWNDFCKRHGKNRELKPFATVIDG